jgi:hypothetical protein
MGHVTSASETGGGVSGRFSRKTTFFARCPNTCPPQDLQAPPEVFFAYCHLGFDEIWAAAERIHGAVFPATFR